MSGKRVTDQQYRYYMSLRNSGHNQIQSSAKAKFSERTGRRMERQGLLPSQRQKKIWKTRKDPFAAVWESVLVPLLKVNPSLNSVTLLEYLQEHYTPEVYPDCLLRTLQRRLRRWRAVYGQEQEIIFRQVHTPGRQGLSDFTTLKGIEITIAGKVFTHLLYHFRLAFSRWSWMKVVQGGESFSALSEGLQDALWCLGGCPQEHRTDSLSAAFKNLSREDYRDMTGHYEALCQHYDMTPTRNNPGKGHENGSVESAHGHLKRRLEQALLLRESYDFESVASYQLFIDRVVQRHNRHHQRQIDVERQSLKVLPAYRTIDFKEVTGRVTTSSTILIEKVVYSVPSRLIGQRLRIHVFTDRLCCYAGSDFVLKLERVFSEGKKKTRCIDYRHLVESLSRKPQAFRYSVLRDDILPNQNYHKIWQSIDQRCANRHACKLIVGILKLAADHNCEEHLGSFVLDMLEKGKIPCLGDLQRRYQSTPVLSAVPEVKVNHHSLDAYNKLLPSLTQERAYA
jgi:hypothetical protein